jgi:hypothetical protein
MFILHLDILAVHLDIGFALVYANEIVVRVKVVEAGLGKSSPRAVLHYDNVVFRVQLGHLDGGFAFVQPQFRIGQAWRNHRCRTVVAESKKDARRQEKLHLTCLRF